LWSWLAAAAALALHAANNAPLLALALSSCANLVTKDERKRWDKMLNAAAPHKGVRNSFIGQMYSATEGLFFSSGKPNKNGKGDEIDYLRTQDGMTLYQTGSHLDERDDVAKEEEKKTPPGPLRPLACLVIRCSYELCAMAREEEQAIYSNTDCVISTSQHAPEIWSRYGLEVALKGQGSASVHAIGYYRVGDKATIPYKQGNPKRRPQAPSGQDEKTTKRVQLMMSGATYCDKWLEVSESWEPSPEITKRLADQEKIRLALSKIKATA